jgi:hypothetical protein
MKKIINFILLLFVSGIASAQVKAYVDTNNIGFADQTILHLQIKVPHKSRVFFPEFKGDTISDKIEIVESYPVDTIKKSPLILEKKYRITSFKDSIHTIPSLPVLVNRDTFYSNPLRIAVLPLRMDSTELAKIDTTQMVPIFGIKKTFDVKFTFKEFWLRFGRWILLALLVAILVILVLWIIKRYKENRPIKLLEKPKEPAHLIAFRRLEALKEKKLYEKSKIKEYYSELTDILRTYIEQRFRIQALERTSSEILADFKMRKIIDDEEFQMLKDVLTMADLAKFAKYYPSSDVGDKNFEETKIFIDKTKEEIVEQDNKNKETEANNQKED